MPQAGLYTLNPKQDRAVREARAMQEGANHSATTLDAQDEGRDPGYVIYVYNLLELEHAVVQPPCFPKFVIQACERGKPFSVTTLPPFIREPYLKPGSTEYFYRKQDGRRAATSLLNPSAFPGIAWEGQLAAWKEEDQAGNNLNSLGVFWSLTKPEETAKLEKEIKLFRDRARKTMEVFIADGERAAASNKLHEIGRMHHFAMDYLGKQAHWHMPTHHMIPCPNCGESVREGIAYHKNSMGEACIINVEKYKEMRRRQREIDAQLEDEDAAPVEAATSVSRKKKAAATTKV